MFWSYSAASFKAILAKYSSLVTNWNSRNKYFSFKVSTAAINANWLLDVTKSPSRIIKKAKEQGQRVSFHRIYPILYKIKHYIHNKSHWVRFRNVLLLTTFVGPSLFDFLGDQPFWSCTELPVVLWLFYPKYTKVQAKPGGFHRNLNKLTTVFALNCILLDKQFLAKS